MDSYENGLNYANKASAINIPHRLNNAAQKDIDQCKLWNLIVQAIRYFS